MKLPEFLFRFVATSEEVIFALGPIGFISFNSDPRFGPGTFTCWLDVPGGSWEL